jgi:hypothetical protein
MKYVCDEKGFPKVKFHGFAVTSQRLMKPFPWYSVDSASALLQAARSGVYVPLMKKKGVFDYSNFYIVHLPLESSFKQKLPSGLEEYLKLLDMSTGRYEFSDKGESTEKYLKKEKTEKKDLFHEEDTNETIVVAELGIITSITLRCVVNMHTLNEFAKTLPKWPWAYQPKSNRKGFNL